MARRRPATMKISERAGATRAAEQVGFDLGASQPVQPPFCRAQRWSAKTGHEQITPAENYRLILCFLLHPGKPEFVTVCRVVPNAGRARETNLTNGKKDTARRGRARCLHLRICGQAPEGFWIILKRLSSSLARVKSGATISA